MERVENLPGACSAMREEGLAPWCVRTHACASKLACAFVFVRACMRVRACVCQRCVMCVCVFMCVGVLVYVRTYACVHASVRVQTRHSLFAPKRACAIQSAGAEQALQDKADAFWENRMALKRT